MRESNEESQEMSDERVQAVIDVYEKRIDRIQKKIDDEDEWVSSMLYHQEQVKVQVCASQCVVNFKMHNEIWTYILYYM